MGSAGEGNAPRGGNDGERRPEPPPDESGPDAVEALVARCLALVEEGAGVPDEAAVARICREHPEHRDDVWRRLQKLAHFGLLTDELTRTSGPSFQHYELLQELGSGGMGVVWLARDRRNGKRVALKTADPRVPWTDRMRERFKREVSAASRLDHPNIVSIDDFGEENGLPFYTMEYIEGPTLAELVAALQRETGSPQALRVEDLGRAWNQSFDSRGAAQVPARWGSTYVQAICRMVLDVAEALDHAHAHGVVHRDVKPGNILIDAEGRAHLFDLGLAHLADHPALTMTADFAGSPHYASPEQIVGSARDLDGRTDVYSLGVTLFEAFALRPPFRAANTPQLLRAIQQQDPPALRSLSPLVPRDLESLCHACLEKRAQHRFESAGQLAEDLGRFLRFEPVHVRPPGRLRRTLRRARRNPALAAAITLAAALLISGPLALWRHEVQLREQRDRANTAAAVAQREARENRQVSSFLQSTVLNLGESGDPEHQRAARDLVEQAIERADSASDLSATTRASLLVTVASVLNGMGRPSEAIPLLDRAFSIRQRELGDDDPSSLETLRLLADSHGALGNWDLARELAQRCLNTTRSSRRDATAESLRVLAQSQVTLAHILRQVGELTEAEEQLAAAQSAYVKLDSAATNGNAAGSDLLSAGIARLRREQGELALDLGRSEEAQVHLERSATILRSLSPTPFVELARCVDASARAREMQGDLVGACQLWEESLALLRKRAGDHSPQVVEVLRRLTRAETANAVAGNPSRPAERARHLALLGKQLVARGDPGAVTAYSQAIELLRSSLEATPTDMVLESELGASLVELADLHLSAQRPEDAAPLAQEANQLSDERLSRPWQLRAMQQLHTLDDLGWQLAPEAGLDQVTRRLEAWTDVIDEEIKDLFETQARLLGARGQWQDATRLLEVAHNEREAPEPLGTSVDPFERLQQRGISALQAGRYDEAADVFQRSLEVRPTDSVAAYNLACSHALANRSDAALDALERALENGFGYRDGAIESARSDTDISSLRGEARFESILAEMSQRTGVANAYAFDAELYVPPKLAGKRSVPLIVLLHRDGETKSSVVRGPWRKVADALGYALLAPGGRVPLGARPEEGTRWAEDFANYGERSLFYEEPIRAAFRGLREKHGLEPERVYIAGSGLAGALAFNTALRSPELVRGAVLVDTLLHEGLAAEKAPHLGSMGFRAALLASVKNSPPGADEIANSLQASRTFRQLREWGIRSTMGSWNAAGSERDPADTLVRAVRWLEGVE